MPMPEAQFKLVDIRDYSTMRCPMHGLLTLLTGPWTTYILWIIHTHGPLRFGQIKKQLPAISAKMLTDRLRMLEEAGILNRHSEATIPPKVTYSFTQRGHQLNELLDEINALAHSWSGEIGKTAPNVTGCFSFCAGKNDYFGSCVLLCELACLLLLQAHVQSAGLRSLCCSQMHDEHPRTL